MEITSLPARAQARCARFGIWLFIPDCLNQVEWTTRIQSQWISWSLWPKNWWKRRSWSFFLHTRWRHFCDNRSPKVLRTSLHWRRAWETTGHHMRGHREAGLSRIFEDNNNNSICGRQAVSVWRFVGDHTGFPIETHVTSLRMVIVTIVVDFS